jgi:hypothetical protein
MTPTELNAPFAWNIRIASKDCRDGGVIDDFAETTFSTTTGVNLGLDHPEIPTEGFGCFDGLFDTGGRMTSRHGNAVSSQ